MKTPEQPRHFDVHTVVNAVFELFILTSLICPVICLAEQSPMTKYWFAVNQGLDVSALESDMQSYCWPGMDMCVRSNREDSEMNYKMKGG